MNTYTNEMFATISNSLKQSDSQSNLSQILRLKPDNTYTVRLLPNINNPSKTLFHYYSHGWNSVATGQYVSAISPTTFGERDPIPEARFRLLKHGTEEEKENSKLLTRRENWLVNVYVINDPVDPENNGKVKILRMGKQLYKIISNAIEGEDAEEFGPRIFDLSKDGCSLKIKVEEQGGYSTYVSSRFTSPQKIQGVTSQEDIDNIYNSVFDLEQIYTVKSYEELKEMLDIHFFCSSDSNSSINEEVVEEDTPVTVSTSKSKESTSPIDDPDDDLDFSADTDDDKIKELLDSMDV